MPMTDRISTLPNILLCHILSFLPTKEAVATSVLAKRWRPLWLSVSTIHFNDQSYLQNKETYFRFLQLVYTVMLKRDVVQPIQRFYLECGSSLCDTSVVNTWVTAAIQRRVEHLILSLPSTINLPCCILTCTTLVVLKLTGLSVNSFSSVGLPSLKTLHLKRVHFFERRDLAEILSACPVLEDLLISSLHFTEPFRLRNGHFKSLPKLVKADISDSLIGFPLAIFYNVEFLRTNLIWSPFSDKSRTFLNLTYMELIVNINHWSALTNLLHLFPNLQILVIVKAICLINSNVYVKWKYPKFVPKCLSSNLKRCCIQEYDGQEGELQLARYLMQNAKVLCGLTIRTTSHSNPEEKLQMIKKLSLCPRISVTCELSFE